MTVYINGTTGISGVDGSAGTPAVQGTDTNTGVFYPAADTVAVSTGGSERMRIDSSGNVGIGTSSPIAQSQLTVASKSLSVTGSDGNFSAGGVRAMVDFAGGTQMRIGALDGGTATATTLAFLTSPGSAGGNERMRIDSSGNLLVGKTTTAETTAGACFSTSVNNIGLSSGNYFIVNYVPGGSSTMIDFRTAGVSKGSISQNGSNVAYNTSSDYRLKDNVHPMMGALEKVALLKPCTYTWKEDGSNGEGFIAHELAEVCPGAVNGEKDAVNEDGSIKPQGIDTSFLVATLTAAIQEQQALITALTARITALETK